MYFEITPALRQQYGLRDYETVSEPSQPKRAKTDTERLILEAVYASREPVTRLEIATALCRKKTPHLIQVIESLVDRRLLRRFCVAQSNGFNCYWYEGV